MVRRCDPEESAKQASAPPLPNPEPHLPKDHSFAPHLRSLLRSRT